MKRTGGEERSAATVNREEVREGRQLVELLCRQGFKGCNIEELSVLSVDDVSTREESGSHQDLQG